jgi:hypothetical protein
MLAQLATKSKRVEPSRATTEPSRASYRATSILSSPMQSPSWALVEERRWNERSRPRQRSYRASSGRVQEADTGWAPCTRAAPIIGLVDACIAPRPRPTSGYLQLQHCHGTVPQWLRTSASFHGQSSRGGSRGPSLLPPCSYHATSCTPRTVFPVPETWSYGPD